MVNCSLGGVGGKQTDSDAEIAEEFNRNFSSIFSNDNEELPFSGGTKDVVVNNVQFDLTDLYD